MTAKLLVLYGPPEDATAFANHYEQVHAPLARKVRVCGRSRSATVR